METLSDVTRVNCLWFYSKPLKDFEQVQVHRLPQIEGLRKVERYSFKGKDVFYRKIFPVASLNSVWNPV